MGEDAVVDDLCGVEGEAKQRLALRFFEGVCAMVE
jgi:hypothetical protein